MKLAELRASRARFVSPEADTRSVRRGKVRSPVDSALNMYPNNTSCYHFSQSDFRRLSYQKNPTPEEDRLKVGRGIVCVCVGGGVSTKEENRESDSVC